MNQSIFLELSKLGFILGGFWALIQFWSANEFKKSQYLSELWSKFYNTEKFVAIFDALDRDDLEAFSKIESKDLFMYLAYLEEIVIFRKSSFWQIYKIRDENLINLFQYHFYNIYLDENSKCRIQFWNKLLKKDNSSNDVVNIDIEHNKEYWKLQFAFAEICAKAIQKKN